MKVSMFMSAAFAAILMIGFTSCKKDQDDGSGKVFFEITDAPIDDANIEGVFITVASIKVDGREIDNFSGTQTIDLMAYQNGQVKKLGSDELDIGTYNDISLVLNYDKDDNNVSPGCYVLTKDGVKHPLKVSANDSTEIKITAASFNVRDNEDVTAVIDFDLRKAVRYGSAPNDYRFVTDTELNAATRLVVRDNAGQVKGNVDDNLGLAGSKIVVYAYQKGAFTNAETDPQGASGIMFKNAVSSAVCDENGNYTLAFLEAGEYDLRFIGYQDANSDGKMEEKGSLVLNILGGLNLNAIVVSAESTVQLNVNVTGILPL